jgi:peptidoglycan/LPS O-acetylase OafA/YrhL
VEAESKATSNPDPKSHPMTALDMMRGLAALAVVLAHARGLAFPAYGELPPDQQGLFIALFYGATRMGGEAVLIFFVLSGYLVGGQIINRCVAGRFDAVNYAIDRVSRIMLPLTPAVLVTVLVGSVFYATPIDPLQIAANMSGLNMVMAKTMEWNGPLWSLPYEIWFYIFGGAAAVLLTGPRTLALPLLGAALAVFCVLDSSFLLFWVAGAMMVRFRDHPHVVPMFWVGIASAVAGAILLQAGHPSVSLSAKFIIPEALARLMLCMGVALSLPLLSSAAANAMLQPLRRPFLLLSVFSYSLYLFHYPAMMVVMHLAARPEIVGAGSLALFAGLVASAIGAGVTAYFLFERHTDRLRRSLKAWRKSGAPGPAGRIARP